MNALQRELGQLKMLQFRTSWMNATSLFVSKMIMRDKLNSDKYMQLITNITEHLKTHEIVKEYKNNDISFWF
jgi:hypothetical protein